MSDTRLTSDMTRRGALAGCKVVDFSRLAPGPMATMILADLGADVIKIEQPGGGRRSRDERAASGGASAEEREQRLRIASPLERNKRSIALDLRNPRGHEVALRLVERADVIVEGFRPGVMARLGLDWERVRALQSRAIYCSISGYGQAGPRASRVGHDLNYLAYAGALSLIGTEEGMPVVPINVIADYAAGSLQAVVGILAALIARNATGLGQYLDVSMTDGVVALLGVEIARLLATGDVPGPGSMYLTGGAAYYNVYRTRDGRAITIACNEPHFYANLCAALRLPELADRQFVDLAGQRENRRWIQTKISERTLEEWIGILTGRDVPFEPVRALDEVVKDQALWDRGVLTALSAADGTMVTQVAPMIRLSGTPTTARHLAPMPGADTDAIMRELGYADAEVSAIRAAGAFGS